MKVEVSSNGFVYLIDKHNKKVMTICPSDIPLVLEAFSISYNKVHEQMSSLALEKQNKKHFA